MDDQIRDMMYILGGIVLIAVVGLVGITWTELDKNDKCVQLINDPNLDAQKHEDIIRKFCR